MQFLVTLSLQVSAVLRVLEHRVSVQWEVVAAEAQPLATQNTKVSSKCYRDVSETRVFTGISPTYFNSIYYVQKRVTYTGEFSERLKLYCTEQFQFNCHLSISKRVIFHYILIDKFSSIECRYCFSWPITSKFP